MSDRKKLAKPIVIGTLVTLGAIGFVMGDEGEPANGNGHDATIAEGVAWDRCKAAVEEQVRNPETVDYVLTSVTYTPDEDGLDIAGTLTAENDFGVRATLAFSCEVDENMTVAEVVAAGK